MEVFQRLQLFDINKFKKSLLMNIFKKLFNLGPNFEVHFTLDKVDKNEKYRLPYFKSEVPIYLENDLIRGSVEIKFKDNKQQIIHNGIDISVVGQFRNVHSESIDQFYIRTTNLSSPGTINEDSTLNFDLEPIRCPIPSYYGTNYDSRYVLELKINSYSFTEPFYYLTFIPPPPKEPTQNENNLLSEIGIEGILHIKAVFKNFYFETSDTIIGLLFFETIKLKIVNCYLQIQRVESYQTKLSSFKLKTDIYKYQLLDGIPCRGDQIPIRVFMPGTNAWPYPNTTANLKVSYYIRLLFIDVNGKHYHRKLGDFIYRSSKDQEYDRIILEKEKLVQDEENSKEAEEEEKENE